MKIRTMGMKTLALFLGMACDDLVFDLVVSSSGKNASGEELVFGSVRAAVDDAFGVGIADAGEGFELIGCCCIDIERSGGRGCSRSWFGRLGNAEDRSYDEEKGDGA